MLETQRLAADLTLPVPTEAGARPAADLLAEADRAAMGAAEAGTCLIGGAA